MQTHTRSLLVIITEAALERALVRAAREHGAQGWTIADVRGGSEGGTRDASWEADRSIERKVVCEASVARTVAQLDDTLDSLQSPEPDAALLAAIDAIAPAE